MFELLFLLGVMCGHDVVISTLAAKDHTVSSSGEAVMKLTISKLERKSVADLQSHFLYLLFHIKSPQAFLLAYHCNLYSHTLLLNFLFACIYLWGQMQVTYSHC